MSLFSNPELLRNFRTQLRPTRMGLVAAICLLLSIVIGYSMTRRGHFLDAEWGRRFLTFILGAQLLTLALVGGISCLFSIYRERELNTFDFQRVTRLSPLELTLGKLFGAPILAWFIVLCLMPAAIVAAFYAGVGFTFFIAAYLVLLLAGILFHSIALLFSLLTPRGSSAFAMLAFLLTLWFLSFDGQVLFVNFHLLSLSPLQVSDLLFATTWSANPAAMEVMPDGHIFLNRWADSFFGISIHHFLVLVILYLTSAAWVLLAVARNIKRDSSSFELYTPLHTFTLMIWISFLGNGFFRWESIASKGFERSFSSLDAQNLLYSFSLAFIIFLGLALLRNRDQIRSLLRQGIISHTHPLAALWPAYIISSGVLLIGFASLVLINAKRSPADEWDLGFALFRLVFLAVWLGRDLLFLQWMNLRRKRRPFLLGLIYLVVFYIVTCVVVANLPTFLERTIGPFAAALLPTVPFDLRLSIWHESTVYYALALLFQLLTALFFAAQQRRILAELASPASPLPPASVPPSLAPIPPSSTT